MTTGKIKIAAIVAVADNGVIGRSHGQSHLGLPWRIKSEFDYFKRVTMGHPLIMGRKSFEAIGKPLPGRPTIIVTRDKNWSFDGVTICHNLDDALRHGADKAHALDVDMVFVAGGAEIYALAMPLIDVLYFTEIHMSPEGDIRFPLFDRAGFSETKREFHKANAGEDADYTITVLARKKPPA